jgi:hypothetical protein
MRSSTTQSSASLGETTNASSLSTGAAAVLVLLDSVEWVAKDTPLVENSASTFGNPAFRTFYDRVLEVCAQNPNPNFRQTHPEVTTLEQYTNSFMNGR